jgi:hypothetical protein
VREHDHVLYHFGGKSGTPSKTKKAKGMDVDHADVVGWFAGHSVDVVERA